MTFNDSTWRDQLVEQFDFLRDYAWTNERTSQLMREPPSGVTTGPSTGAGAAPAQKR